MLKYAQLDDFEGLSDTQLLRLYKNGNQTAFQQLAIRYIFIIRAKAYNLYNKGVESEDLFQEGLLALHYAACSFDENGDVPFSTYAGVCVRNRLISAVRTANTNKNRINNISVYLDDTESNSYSLNDPENILIIREDLEKLTDYIKTNLSKTELRVLSLYLDGSSYNKIASVLGITKKSCDNAMQRVRKKLKIIDLS